LTLRVQTGSPDQGGGVNTFLELFECIFPQVANALPPHPSPVEFITTTISMSSSFFRIARMSSPPSTSPIHTHRFIFVVPPLVVDLCPMLYFAISHVTFVSHSVPRGLSDDSWLGLAMPQLPQGCSPWPFPADGVNPERATPDQGDDNVAVPSHHQRVRPPSKLLLPNGNAPKTNPRPRNDTDRPGWSDWQLAGDV